MTYAIQGIVECIRPEVFLGIYRHKDRQTFPFFMEKSILIPFRVYNGLFERKTSKLGDLSNVFEPLSPLFWKKSSFKEHYFYNFMANLPIS